MPLISNSTIKLVKVTSLLDRPVTGTADYVIYCVDNGVDPKTFWIWRNSAWEEIYTTITDEYIITRQLTGLVIAGGTITSTDTILGAFGKLQNQLNAVASPMIYQGTWNANTNSPTLTSSVGTKGHVYRVTTSGATNIDGTTDWKSGDFIVFNGTTWDKWDSTDAVTSVNGYTGNVVLVKADVGLGNVPNIDATNPANIVQNTNFRFVTDAEKTYWNGKQDALGYIPEDVANKATTMTGNTTSNVKYLTSKAVYDWGTSTFIPLNAPIVGATKTKITYDSKGLVTAGADATTADIADSLNKRYVTDANLVVINNTSNTNTGDETQTSIKTKLGEASAIQDGYLSAFYWSAFNNKQSAISLTNLGNSGAATFIANTLNIPVYTLAGLGGVSSSRSINTTAPLQGGGDLSADRTLTITQATTGSSGYLSSTDWNKFNDKQDALSGGITNRVTKWTSASTIGNSTMFDDGSLVGLGTVAPTAKLHINNTTVSNSFLVEDALNPDLTPFVIDASGSVGIGTTTPSAKLHINAVTANLALLLVEDDTNPDPSPFIITDTGSVGIGTTAPAVKFHVVGNGNAISWEGADHIYHQFYPKGIAAGRFAYFGYSGANATNLSLVSEKSDGDLVLASARDLTLSTANTTRLFVSLAGDVGIGTSLPGAKLNVAGNVKINTILNATTDTDRFLVSDAGIVKYRTGAELLSDIGGQGTISLTTTGSSGAATFTSGTLNVPNYTLAGLGGEPIITSGTTAQYWRGDKTWQTLNTTAVAEGTNLYFTETRVRTTPLTGLSIAGGSITSTDSVLSAFGKIQNQLNAVASPMIYQGTWNANTNTPALTSSVGTKGYVYRVTTSGATNIDGVTDWKSGDFIVFNGTTWDKWDATDAVTSVNGYTGVVVITKSDVGLSNVENTALSTWPGTTNITTLGTIGTGVWQGTAIADAYIASAATWNAKVGGTGTANYLPLWSNSTTLATSAVYQDPATSNIGIGTNTPTVNLHIARSTTENFYINLANSSGPLGETTTTDTTKRARLIASNTNSASVSIGQIGTTNTAGSSFGAPGDSYLSSSPTAQNLNIVKQPGNGSTTDHIKFFAGNLATATPTLTILGSGANKGNIGINVAAPNAALEIGAFSDAGIVLYNQADDTSRIEITSSQNTQNYLSFIHNVNAPLDTIISTTSSNGTATSSLFKIQTYGTDALIIDSNQNVAIGTIPSARLHVNNTTSVNSFLVEDSTNPDTTPFVIDSAGSVGVGLTTPSTLGKLVVQGNGVTGLVLNTDSITATNSTRLFFRQSDTNDVSMFNVNGSLRFAFSGTVNNTSGDNKFIMTASGSLLINATSPTLSPTAPLTTYATGTASAEEVARFSVYDVNSPGTVLSSFMSIRNGTSTDSEFIPQLRGNQASTSTLAGLDLISLVPDTATTNASFLIRATNTSGGAIINRPSFEIRNAANVIMGANYNTTYSNNYIGFGHNSPTAKVHVRSGLSQIGLKLDKTSTSTQSFEFENSDSGNEIRGFSEIAAAKPIIISNTTNLNNEAPVSGSLDIVFNILGNRIATIADTGNVGIGVNTPSTKLHINSATSGAFRLVDTTQGANKYLKSDANGVGTWSTITTPSLSDVMVVGNNTENKNIIFNSGYGLDDSSSRSTLRFDSPDQVTITNTKTLVGSTNRSVLLINGNNVEASIGAEKFTAGVSIKYATNYVCDTYSDSSVLFTDIVANNEYNTNLKISKSTILIGSTLNSSFIDPDFRGAEYLHNYASNYTNRSLVDKEYVDIAVSTVTVGTTASVSHTVKAGIALTKGQAVYVSSADGTNMIVSKADYSTEATSSKTMGLVMQDLALNGIGLVITEGLLEGLNTSTANAGDAVWLGDDGNLLYGLANKPVAPNHIVFIGIVTRANINNGEIFVKPQNGFELSELHDVQILTEPHSNETLTYDTASNLWKPSFIPPIGDNEVFRGRTFRYDSTTVDTYAGLATLNNASAISVLPNTTNFGNKYTRLRYYASIVSTGRVTSIRSTDLQWYIGGGFRFISTWRVADTAFGATCQNFHGLISTVAEIAVGGAGLTQVSTLTNCIFIGSDGADVNLQVMHNDAVGTCTKIDLGAGFPSNRTAGAVMTTMYSCEIYNQVNSSNVKYRVINLETGEVAQGIITTNLPATTQGLAIQSARVMGSPVTNSGQWEQHKWGCSDITV